MQTNVLIAGSGCAGMYCALHLPKDMKVTIITKKTVDKSDSFLAQGGICMLKSEDDYDSYFEDTMKAGHYENDKGAVEIMIKSSQDVIQDLVSYGTDFHREPDGSFSFTKEGAHSDKRILFHEDITGKEISSHLYDEVKSRSNISVIEYAELTDIIEEDGACVGGIVNIGGETVSIYADFVVLATGGIGGRYEHSTNYSHIRGDAIDIAKKHGVALKHLDYVQIHPTTFYTEEKEERSFLISESVRGEGAKLYDKNGNRFVNELLPRDVVTSAIYEQMEKDGTKFVWEDLTVIDPKELEEHFPNIVEHCANHGYDVRKQWIPVVPAQHYFMGGIDVDYSSHTSMERLYAVGETACNGVHGKNRLASNSLLESLVFAKRAAHQMAELKAEREVYV
ncbi:MAG: L-aspartate oxidase [Lachnospiraceae bacterium]|nr:L-aspartate oxidase [Lachnospiraceae bacterium]